MDRQHRIAFWVSVGSSILLHLLLAGVLVLAVLLREDERERVELTILDKGGVAVGGREGTVVSRPPREPPPRGQVVDLAKPDVEEVPPPDARFLSRWNSRVEHEQKAKDRGQDRSRRVGVPVREPSPVQSPDSRSAEPTQLQDSAKGPRPEGPAASGSGVTALPGKGDRVPGMKGLAGMDKLLLPGGGSRNAVRNLQALTGGGLVSDDGLHDVPDEGSSTLLNARSFRYWDFFQRVKERVRSEWDPGEIYRSRDPYGKVYGAKDRLTILSVVLDSAGKVTKLSVSKHSGLPFLDSEAARAFREASPFPNPPKGLADDEGRIAFNFGFLLEMTSSRFQFFWQRPPE
jgi:TonB family protein